MYGLRNEFKYYHCNNCGCLQISNIPSNLNIYYPENYYSYCKPELSKNKVVNYLRRKRSDYFFNNYNTLITKK